jgi:hypothetical protein
VAEHALLNAAARAAVRLDARRADFDERPRRLR